MQDFKKYSIVSIPLIAISALVAILSNLGSSPSAFQPLLIASPNSAGLTEVFDGQFWRLISPIFIHFGPFHILFNCLMIWDLGKLVEGRKGVWFYAGFVLIVGVVSNLAQYLMTGLSNFGGLSGVLYGLFGYLWMQGRFNPDFGIILNKNTVLMMLGWFALCWTGLLGPIANWAHTGGLVAGVVWGFVSRSR